MLFKQKVTAIHVPHYKNTDHCASRVVEPPKEVILPMSMHSGAAAVPVVEVGDYVRVGQLIGREDGKISAPVHASVSGTVKEIAPVLQTGGRKVLSITIESDGKMEKDPTIVPPVVNTLDDFLNALKLSGIVGLGGAAFPVWKKWEAVKHSVPDTILINGAECEPFATSDNRTMVEDAEYIKKGIDWLKKFVGAKEYVIGVEDNKPEAIQILNETFKDDDQVRVHSLKASYPQGAKQTLLFNITGKVVKEGERLSSVGVIIINVTTLAKCAHFLETGMPLVERVVTVDGSAINNPSNLIVPIGTKISYLIEQAGGLKEPAGKIVVGGPMMGYAAASAEEPIVKASNAVLVFNKKDANLEEPSPCINCGKCVQACPLSLMPTEFAHALEIEDEAERYAKLNNEYIMTCMECGCCSFVCPAHRQIVDVNRQAKKFVRAYKKQLEEQAQAKEAK